MLRLTQRPIAGLRFWLASIALLWLMVWVRLVYLNRLPVFVDEGTHLQWTQAFVAGTNAYPRLMDGRVGLMAWLALFQLNGPAPLWVARAASAVAATLSCAACLSLGAHFSSRTALLAGLLYAILPYAVFHDRQALADPLTAALGALALALLVRLAQHSRWAVVIPLGLALAASILVKFTSAIYLAGWVWAMLILPTRSWRAWLLKNLAALGVALGVAGLTLLMLQNRLGNANSIFANTQLSYVTCPPLVCAGNVSEQLRRLPEVINGWLSIIPPYFGWPLMVLAGSALFAAQHRRVVVFLWVTMASMTFAMWLAATQALPPRYYSFLAVPLSVLAAQGIETLTMFGETRFPNEHGFLARPIIRVWVGAIAIGVVLWPMANTWPIITHPTQANLPAIDMRQYVSGPYAGVGFAEAAHSVQADNALVLAESWFPLSLSAYLDSTRLRLMGLGNISWPEAEAALNAGQNIYIVDRVLPGRANADTAIDPTTLGLYPRLNGEGPLRVRLIQHAQPEALKTLFTAMFPRPEGFLDQYDALLAQSAPEPTWLTSYPPSQFPFLVERWTLAHSAQIPLDIGGAQPWDTATVINQLAQIDLGDARLRVIFFDESRLDPHRAVETWLVTHLFREGEQFVGALRVMDFVGGGAVQPTQRLPVGARFGESITLDTLEILDESAQPNSPVRVRLTWRAEAPVDETLKVFVHLFAGENIVAQHDGQPVGELRPTRTWAVGESIVDQFAIRLPTEAAPGTYQLRIGLYNADTQARWPAQLADGAVAEFFVGGAVIVK